MEQYEEFKKEVESFQIIEEKEYQKIEYKYGTKKTEQLFEKYINDETIPNSNKKFKRIKSYIEMTEEKYSQKLEQQKIYKPENKETEDQGIETDTVKQYLKKISSYPILSREQEKELATEIDNLKRQIKKRNITDESLNIEMSKIGYPKKIENSQHSRQGQMTFILKRIEELELGNFIEEISKLKNLFDDIRIQHTYTEKIKEFTQCNLKLVVHIANRYTGCGIKFLDLIQEGNLGLINAIDKYDVKKGYKFSSYAIWWIKYYIKKAIAEQSKIVKIPVYLMSEYLNKIIIITNNFESKFGRQPTEEELAQSLNISLNKTREFLRLINPPLSLSMPIGLDENATLNDIIPDQNNYSIEKIISSIFLKEELEKELQKLTLQEQIVIKKRFGIEDNCPKTLANIGKSLNLSRERIRQIEQKGLKKLRKAKVKEKLKEYL